MINLFRTRTRAKHERALLYKELIEITDQKKLIIQTRKPYEYGALSIREGEIKHQIELLDKILEK